VNAKELEKGAVPDHVTDSLENIKKLKAQLMRLKKARKSQDPGRDAGRDNEKWIQIEYVCKSNVPYSKLTPYREELEEAEIK
jgi:hypothetical protein